MPRTAKKKKPVISSAKASKYDAHHKVIDNTYGDFADLRHQLSESKEDVAERAALLKLFSECADSQRSWLLLEDGSASLPCRARISAQMTGGAALRN